MSLSVLPAVRVSQCSHLFLLATVLDRSPDVQPEHRHHDHDSHNDHDHDRGQVGGDEHVKAQCAPRTQIGVGMTLW